MSGFSAEDVTDQSGRVFVVTGANSGLGFEASKVLASRGARVLMACRSEDRARNAMDAIRRETPDADIEYVRLDLASLESIGAAAERITAEPRIDVLVNNAGVMVPPLSRTEDGFELQFGVNHLGTFALTGLLLDKLEQGNAPRVVITSSLAHTFGSIDFADPGANRRYSRWRRYGMSKLANLIHMIELDRRLCAAGRRTIATACHPGMASTELSRHTPLPGVFDTIAERLFNSAAQGAWPTLQAATWEKADGGDYFGPTGFRETRGKSGYAKKSATARDPELAARLWELSIALTGIDPAI